MRWLIKPEAVGQAAADSRAAGTPGGPLIPSGCIAPLHQLNSLQRQLEKLQGSRRTLLDRLSSDWHKYMLCAYPPPASRDEFPEADKVAYLIKSTTVKSIERIDAKVLAITAKRDADAAEIHELLSRANLEKEGAMALVLKAIPGPRFWAPRDPVVVLEAPPELAVHLPGAAERLDTSSEWAEIELPRVPGLSFWDILEDRVVGPFKPSDRRRQDDPARPIYVEWSAQLFSRRRASTADEGDFARDHLSTRFAPAAGSPDLTPRTPHSDAALESAYTGRSLISANSAQVLHDRIVAYLTQMLGDGATTTKHSRRNSPARFSWAAKTDLSITLHSAFCALEQHEESDIHWKVFGINIDGGLNLSNLPLVGKVLPAHETLSLEFQALYSSRKIGKDDVEKLVNPVNTLLPEGATPLPTVGEGDAPAIKEGIDQSRHLPAPWRGGPPFGAPCRHRQGARYQGR